MRPLTRLMALALCLTGTSLAEALPANSIERVYFSNSTYRNAVGSETIMTCQGRPQGSTLEGRRSRYAISYAESCNQGTGRQSIACYLDGRLTSCPADVCSSPLVVCRN